MTVWKLSHDDLEVPSGHLSTSGTRFTFINQSLNLEEIRKKVRIHENTIKSSFVNECDECGSCFY